jgi:hypothetical protein
MKTDAIIDCPPVRRLHFKLNSIWIAMMGFMLRETRMSVGILLVILPTVIYERLSLLSFLTRNSLGYTDNPSPTDCRSGSAPR